MLLIFLASCKKNEILDEGEMKYVKTTISLSKVRGEVKDSLSLEKKQDSVYHLYATTKVDYKKQTVGYADNPVRAAIIFRAINDSIGVR